MITQKYNTGLKSDLTYFTHVSLKLAGPGGTINGIAGIIKNALEEKGFHLILTNNYSPDESGQRGGHRSYEAHAQHTRPDGFKIHFEIDNQPWGG